MPSHASFDRQDMSTPSHVPVHELMKQARIAAGLTFEAVAGRTGVREPLLAAMESGRWHDLPHGLYARAAVRNYATFLGLDPDPILAACESQLAPMEDPIAALARLRGGRPPAPA